MPIYEYLAERCRRQAPCSKRLEYIQSVSAPALAECRECGAPIRRIFSSFAAKADAVGVSTPDPTPLNITGISAPSTMPSGGQCGGEGHRH
jgi:putative FmdB family regulatory protein